MNDHNHNYVSRL